jgi:hypothetical protein
LLSNFLLVLGTGLIGAGSLVTAFGWHHVFHMARERFGLSD